MSAKCIKEDLKKLTVPVWSYGSVDIFCPNDSFSPCLRGWNRRTHFVSTFSFRLISNVSALLTQPVAYQAVTMRGQQYKYNRYII